MFMSISTTGTAGSPATDLGFLLHKHPGKVQQFSTSHGEAHVFYPEAGDEACTAALLLDVDPIALVRKGRGKGRGGSPDFALAQYVNDRPYAASSLLAVALRTVFRTAMKGVCEARPGLVDVLRPLRIVLPAVPANGAGDGGGVAMAGRLFEPLGWRVEASAIPLDEAFPEWGESRYVRLELSATEVRLADALQQLYVLLPVLDGAKHYWVAPDEVDKLLAAGEGWLADHPEQALIARRYLSRRWTLTRRAMERLELARLAEADDREVEEIDNAVDDTAEETGPQGTESQETALQGTASPEQPAGERKPSLAEQRRTAILAALAETGAARVADLGCGQGELIGSLLEDARITEVLGVDVSARALSAAARKLRLERMTERQAARVKLVQGALTYTDARLKGFDAAVLSEVIEHLDLPRLPALEYAVFGAARPAAVVVTTPNVEYNVRWESLPAGHVRHADHRFEWDRAEFRAWAVRVAEAYGYTVVIRPVGPEDDEVGAPTQLALFRIGTPPVPTTTVATHPGTAGTADVTATEVTTADVTTTEVTTTDVTTTEVTAAESTTTPEGGETR
ncbi:3' terminal RNA ribose 2'-O-methyltransferase Hen1 [Kitasatospora sp. RG8]|uniref:3' terminal RNA ribose 2'-O-methyltransferase Hen1 n=1 Tax=Kitasatospora sp. RG8 TaxID=2820815 RepID=UPI001AE0722B|nr:3' terminal RNA ribose 2'-O-methyltransferase Hen1 [Kitasatospora sp. RG8]MBP0454714.1 3' terminal RNA ribose 2'-O-methyltransferase Hen1 [Kitasatospora sp. RG8]